MKGLLVEVMGHDCTAGGVTSGKDAAILVGARIPKLFPPHDGEPTLELVAPSPTLGYRLVMRNGNAMRVLAKPHGKPPGIFGGRWIWSSDSRFPADSPIPVYDRYEQPEGGA